MNGWGIDVSNRNPGVNMAEVKRAGAGWAYLKATEGVDFTDGLYAGYRRQAIACGLPFGAYHFGHPQPGRSPEAEVAHFLSTTKAAGGFGQLRPALDLEWTMYNPEATAAWALRFLELVEAETGVVPMFYSYPDFLTEHVRPWELPALGKFPLWLADYQGQMPAAPAPWRSFSLWQHTSTGHVPGVPGFVDVSVVGTDALLYPSFPEAHKPAPAHAPAHKPPTVVHGGGVVLGSRVLVKGDRGADVAFLQRFLGLVSDGDFGDKTEAAVKGYQHMRGLTADGEVGRLTWRAILGR